MFLMIRNQSSARLTLFNDVKFKEFSESVSYLFLNGYISLFDIFTGKEKSFEISERLQFQSSCP